MTFPKQNDGDDYSLGSAGGEEPSLPPAINLPIAAEDLSYEVKLNLTSKEERLAALEEKKNVAQEKIADAQAKRSRGQIILGVMIVVFFICLYEIFFAPADKSKQDFAKTVAGGIVIFLTGNSLPKLSGESDEKKKD